MKVKTLHLDRFRGFEDLQVSFPKEAQLIVFIGENGCGKSSLLEGISMILRDSLYKHHNYDKVDWNNPKNVHTLHQYGSISIELQGPKRIYNFKQQLSVKRTRFISEDRLSLDLNRDLTDEDRMEHYKIQADMAFDAAIYEKSLTYFIKLAELQENILGFENPDLAITYRFIGLSYYNLNESLKALEYYEKAITILEKELPFSNTDLAKTYNNLGVAYASLKNHQKAIIYYEKAVLSREKILSTDDIDLAYVYNNLGVAYATLKNYQNAIIYYEKALIIKEKTLASDDISLLRTYKYISLSYTFLGDLEKAAYFNEKVKEESIDKKEIKDFTPDLYLYNDTSILEHFNEYIETLPPVVLHYSVLQTPIENYKGTLHIAFNIPMTIDFDMILGWFIEQENDENRKRLRHDNNYRSTELQTIREVITLALTLLNGEKGNHFTELQTETEEIVKDGQVSSWLSIKKNELRLNVNQLSDGEKRVLILFIDITRRLITNAKLNKSTAYLESRGIVLIDEIEQHLHPKWQRMLLPTLSKIFPNLQFIVTTHSPQVLSYVPNGCAFSLIDGKAYPQNTYGRDNEWILEAIMDDVNRPVEIQDKLNTYFDLIREDKLEEALPIRKELEDIIGTDEPELLKADILIRRKQKSMAKNEAN